MKIHYTQHAIESLKLRNIDKKLVDHCLQKPDISLPARKNKKAYLKDMGNNYLKVIAVEENDMLIVITAYRFEKDRVKF